MAMAPQRRTLAAISRCDNNKAEYRNRGTSCERGYDSDWQRVADEVRERDEYLCVNCIEQAGVMEAMRRLAQSGISFPVDHIIPIHVRPDWRLEPDNCQTLCPSCHTKKTSLDSETYGSSSQSTLTDRQQANRDEAQKILLNCVQGRGVGLNFVVGGR